MRSSAFIFLFVFLAVTPARTQDARNIRISGSWLEVPLDGFLLDLEQRYPVRFYFEKEWVEGLSITAEFTGERLENVLDNLFSGSRLRAVYFNSHAVALMPAPEGFIPDDMLQGGQIRIGSPFRMEENKPAAITGNVLDGSNGEGIVGANVRIRELNRGTASGPGGAFRLELEPGIYTVAFSSIGYQEVEKEILLYSDGRLDVELFEKTMAIEQVDIIGSENPGDFGTLQMSASRLSLEKINRIPAFLGESDVVKSILLLPGISSMGESAAGVYVRGGDAGQNLFLLDEVPLFNFTHMFGFFSAVNPEVVKDITVYKGGIPAFYGGRLSSVMDVRLKDEAVEKIRGSGSLGMITAKGALQVPVLKHTGYFLLGARTSYSDWFLRQIPNLELQNSGASFHDFNARFGIQLNRKHSLALSGFSGRDDFLFDKQARQIFGSQYGNASYDFVSNRNLSLHINGNTGQYRSELSEFNDTLHASTLKTGADHYKLSAGITYYRVPGHDIKGGFEGIFYVFRTGERIPYNISSIIESESLQDERCLESAFYLSDEVRLGASVSVSAGIRYSLFSNLGPREEYEYYQGLPRSPETITDTVYHPAGKWFGGYGGLEPRLSARFELNKRNSLKISYNRMKQYIHLFSNTTTVTPTDIWKPSGGSIEPQTGDQLALGYYRLFPKLQLETSAEVYYKYIHHLMDFRGGAEVLMNPALETELLAGCGRAYGLELYLKKARGRLNGWISYTYSRSERRVSDPVQQEEINRGQFYPADYDKPHDLSVYLNYRLTSRLSVSAGYLLSTGRPLTLPEGSYEIDRLPVIHYSDKNQYRIPDYRRCDAGLTLDLNLKKNRKWYSSLTFSVYNLFGRKNPYSVFFRNENNVVLKGYQVMIINQAVPSLTYNFRFNQ